MKKYICFVIILIYPILFFKCTPPEIQGENIQKKFFDIPTFISEEKKRLDGTHIRKTIQLNEKSESQHIKDPNWEQELSEFSKTNINKPALRDKYEEKSSGKSKKYIALDKTLHTKEVRLEYPGNIGEGNPSRIYILKEKNNILNRERTEMNYSQVSGFSIRSIRKSISDETADTILITIEYLP